MGDDYERMKQYLPQYVERITTRSKGENMYICPLCGSGTGKNKTGAFSLDMRDPAHPRWKCFACGEGGDLFDLIRLYENLPAPYDQLKRAGDILLMGAVLNPDSKPLYQRKKQEDMNIHTYTYTQPEEGQQEDFTSYFQECQSRLKETSYHTQRGISEATASRFKLGYDPHYTRGTGGKEWQALIIPTGPNSYVARNTDPGAGESDRYRKTGPATPINAEALQRATKPIFIVEGELDALSIIEAGGEAIGLGSTANIGKFINQYLKEQKPAKPLVLALDNDEAGQTATKKLATELEKLEIPFYRLNPYMGKKDANGALMENREAFIKAVAEAENIGDMRQEAERELYLMTSASSHLKEFYKGIADSANTPAQSTGFSKLDEVLEGGLYEGLYILGAITSLGKTTLALQMADQIAETGKDVLIFSLEMARTELMGKSISRQTLIQTLKDPHGNIKNAKTTRGILAGARWVTYSKEEHALINRAIKAYEKYAGHIFIHEGMGNIGTDYIRQTIDKHRLYTGQTPVVLIDYVQILAPYDVRATDKQNIDKAVLELKRISRDYKTPVIGISSFNRAGYRVEASLEAFKESGALEYGSDVLIGLQFRGAGGSDFDSTEAKQKDPREIELVILKNRNGRTGDKILYRYHALFNYFEEIGQ